MDWVESGAQCAQWLHVVFAIASFGGTMYMDFVVRGIAWGPRNAAGPGFDFSSQYGMTWSISILLALAIAAIGDGFIQRAARTLCSDHSLWSFATGGGPPPAAFTALTGRLRTGALVQLVLFIAVFTCMVLMRFGF